MKQPHKLPFVQYDVFTSQPLQGNPLAVFPDARGLAEEEMQAIAREMSLSETTFILPREADIERQRGVRVRIFTVREEMPFAGHPTLGTAFYLHQRYGLETVELDLNVGKIPVRFTRDAAGRVSGEMTQRNPEFGDVYTPEEIAEATGLPLEAFDRSLPAQTVSTGKAFLIVPLKNLQAMRRLSFDQGRAARFLAQSDAMSFYWVTREVVTPGATLHARMLFYNGEDPATGSAGGCCTAWAVKHGVLGSDVPGVIEQGLEMMRPSYLRIRATSADGNVTNVRVGGEVVEVLRGELTF